MDSWLFLAFDPYLSFSKNEIGFKEKRYYKSDGTPSYSHWNKEDGPSSLWVLGHNIYKKLESHFESELKTDDLVDLAKQSKELEIDITQGIQTRIDEHGLKIFDQNRRQITDFCEAAKSQRDGWVLLQLMGLMRQNHSYGKANDDSLDFETLLSITAMTHISDCIIADQYHDGLDCILSYVHENIAGANLYRETLITAEKTIQANAKKAANSRHTENHAMRTQALEWYASHKHEYSSKEEAAMEITKIVPVKFRTARDWLINQ